MLTLHSSQKCYHRAICTCKPGYVQSVMPKFQFTASLGNSKVWINVATTNSPYCLPVLIAGPDFGPLLCGVKVAVSGAISRSAKCDRKI